MPASTISIHDILDKDDWNYDELKLFLEKDASSINQLNRGQVAPLHRVLLNTKNCSPNVIRLLLYYGADVDLEFSDGKSPLARLLCDEELCDKKEAIVYALLEGFPDIYKLTNDQSFLCFAFSCSNVNVNIIRMLYDAGSPIDSCLFHESIFECFMASLEEKCLNEDLLKFMIETCRCFDLNILDINGQSLLCYALRKFPGCDAFNFMLESGCSLNACEYHDSPWFCATDGDMGHAPHLTNSLVQMLIDVEADPNVDNKMHLGSPLLHFALACCTYEISAIQLMIDTGVVQLGRRSLSEDETDLHAAVSNVLDGFNPKIVKFLVDRGADINAKGVELNTPLHLALIIYFESCNVSKIEALLENGASVNETNSEDDTPLRLWAENRRDPEILQMMINTGARIYSGHDPVVLQLLLNAGARINYGKQTFEILMNAMWGHEARRLQDHIPSIKLLIKYSLLEDPSIDIDSLIPEYHEEVTNFVKECRDELQCMESIYVNQSRTLHQLISRSSQKEAGAEDYEPVNLDRLINALVYNKFHAYFDVICAMLDRKEMEPKLQEIIWCAVKSEPDTSVNTNIFLNSHTIFEIASNLSNEELLKLIISSHILGK